MHGLQDAGLCVCYLVLFSGHAGCSGSDHDFWLQIVMVSPGTHLVNKS